MSKYQNLKIVQLGVQGDGSHVVRQKEETLESMEKAAEVVKVSRRRKVDIL